ncbi:ribonuclease HII [Nocardioides yefusunii]|uniref:Ribonuclease n=1 Tax=Nocardioides yefusunii TaxID=2500546 RepID=A0ABW1QV76_9ACTN|nr:ribonuclease HII [Nocardioides yefusunii]
MVAAVPTLRTERSIIREGYPLLACADEVGRGALGGPVSVGMVVVDADTRTAPQGVKDSKLVPAKLREELAPKVRRWAVAHAVGHASAAEIDAHGIVVGLRLAAQRALAGLGVVPDLVLLDGNHDYLTAPEQFSLFDAPPTAWDLDGTPEVEVPPVRTEIKGDMRCAGVAAASILAKTERDAIMAELATEHPGYAWEVNKGYASPDHVAALATRGPCVQHRRSWSLPGVNAAQPSGTGSGVRPATAGVAD